MRYLHLQYPCTLAIDPHTSRKKTIRKRLPVLETHVFGDSCFWRLSPFGVVVMINLTIRPFLMVVSIYLIQHHIMLLYFPFGCITTINTTLWSSFTNTINLSSVNIITVSSFGAGVMIYLTLNLVLKPSYYYACIYHLNNLLHTTRNYQKHRLELIIHLFYI